MGRFPNGCLTKDTTGKRKTLDMRKQWSKGDVGTEKVGQSNDLWPAIMIIDVAPPIPLGKGRTGWSKHVAPRFEWPAPKGLIAVVHFGEQQSPYVIGRIHVCPNRAEYILNRAKDAFEGQGSTPALLQRFGLFCRSKERPESLTLIVAECGCSIIGIDLEWPGPTRHRRCSIHRCSSSKAVAIHRSKVRKLRWTASVNSTPLKWI